jgi:hypothetical protein
MYGQRKEVVIRQLVRKAVRKAVEIALKSEIRKNKLFLIDNFIPYFGIKFFLI